MQVSSVESTSFSLAQQLTEAISSALSALKLHQSVQYPKQAENLSEIRSTGLDHQAAAAGCENLSNNNLAASVAGTHLVVGSLTVKLHRFN
jgi:hypothetical protein